jgi:hypothetical protein
MAIAQMQRDTVTEKQHVDCKNQAGSKTSAYFKRKDPALPYVNYWQVSSTTGEP